MIDIIYTSLTGYPTQHSGGGNRIIYDLIKNISTDRFSREYFSFTYYKNYGINQFIPNPLSDLPIKKKIGISLSSIFPIYKKLVTSPFYYKKFYNKVDKHFNLFSKNINSDIIHAHQTLALPYFAKNKQKKILTIHSKGGFVYESKNNGFNNHFYEMHFKQLEMQERIAINVADSITFPSIAAKDLFFRVNDIQCPKEKINILYNGIDVNYIDKISDDPNIFNRYKIRNNASLYICNVAEHSTQKNISLLIKAVYVMVNELKKDVVLINIGHGEETLNLKTLVKDLGLKNNVQFLGSIANDDVIKLLKKSDCFVLTSTNVIFDLVVLEALACGTTVFVANDGGNKEVISHGKNGYLIDENNQNYLAKLIIDSDYKSVKLESKKMIHKYSMQQMISNYEKLYVDILNRK